MSADANDEASFGVGKHVYKSLKWGTIRTDSSTLDKFKTLKELGYDGVELDSPEGVDKREALQASRTTGLPIEGIVNSTHWRIRHSDPDPAVRAQALKNMRTALRDAKYVSADSVLLVPGKVTDPKTENHAQVWERSIAGIRKLLPLAAELKIKILIENIGNGFCYDPKQLAQYIDEINSRWVCGPAFTQGGWRVYIKDSDFVAPGPSSTWVLLDEREDTINDGYFAVRMEGYQTVPL